METEHYQPTPENRLKLDAILEQNAKDCARLCEKDITKEAKDELQACWKNHLTKMRQIDRAFCEASGFKIHS